MEKMTVAQSAIKVLQASQQPMSATDITQAIVEQNLYSFKAKDPRGIVRGAIERRCVGLSRKDLIEPTYCEKLPDGTFRLKD
ncbi:MAG: winged helix-turn-helix domain-containing protein [Elainellaceae cyanobacterium]